MKCKVKGIISLILLLAMSMLLFVPIYAADSTEAEKQATALKELGLFKGVSDTDFDLDRAPTRTEALVMLIRVLGKEADALAGTWTHPFTDVETWADKYVGYAFQTGLTKGVSATEFGQGNANCDMYLTFVLRALDYDDAKGDFSWENPDVLAKAVGILPDGVDTAGFLRADVALVSWACVKADVKGGAQTLAKRLLENGTFTQDAFNAAVLLAGEKAKTAVSVSTAAELQSALADSSNKAIQITTSGTPVLVTGALTIPKGVTLTINRGSDFYIDGTLTNNGTIIALGADSDTGNFSVVCLQNSGKFINNGAIRLNAASLADTQDRGPVGGQLRVFGGIFDNNGSVYLEAGAVNTHGGMVVVETATFNNKATFVVDGFFLRVDEEGIFNNVDGAVVINNSTIITEGTGVFNNNGTLSGHPING